MDNRLTVEGTRMHEVADEGRDETRRDLLTVRALPIVSRRLGITGKADVVEFRRADGGGGAALGGREGLWRPTPVEYKRGRPKRHRADEVQLCAQALCLEEMFEVHIEEGRLFYGERQRRTRVHLDRLLRELTAEAIGRLRELFEGGAIPPARYEPRKCDRCSLKPACLPEAPRRTEDYLLRALALVGDDAR